MAQLNKYGVRDLEKDFPNDRQCLEFVFNALHSTKCSCGGTYKLIEGRKQYQCSKCRFQIAPTSGTIFHKSDTPLTLWFKTILMFSNAKSGLSAKYLERELNVTYKTAWRMLKLIRKSLEQDKGLLKGDVEMDSAYFGGKKSAGKNNELLSVAMKAKSVVMGAVQRKGNIKAQVMADNKADTQFKFITESIEPNGTRLMTDSIKSLHSISSRAFGYDRHMVDHHRKEYVRGDIHTNTIEAFWAHAKRSIKGTHKVISPKYLQSYLNGFVFHRNNRHNDRERFSALLGVLLSPSR